MYYSNNNKVLSEEEKRDMIERASLKYREFMEILRIDLEDPNSKDTPSRVSKMLVNELWKGRYSEKPIIQSFPNTKKYDQIIFTNCETISVCAHHHVPIINKIFIGVLSNPDPKSRLIGLSKYTRIVEWVANRPTIQEDMTNQIHEEIDKICKDNFGVMIYIIGQHGCTVYRGVKQQNSKMITSQMSGEFRVSHKTKEEFLSMVRNV